jgi:hypothetical protein
MPILSSVDWHKCEEDKEEEEREETVEWLVSNEEARTTCATSDVSFRCPC